MNEGVMNEGVMNEGVMNEEAMDEEVMNEAGVTTQEHAMPPQPPGMAYRSCLVSGHPRHDFRAHRRRHEFGNIALEYGDFLHQPGCDGLQ